MFKQVVWVPSYRGNTAAHEDNYTKPLKILPYPQGSYSLSLIATIIEKIKRRKTCFTTQLKFILLCLPYVHFAASHAVHFFPQIEANELLIFPLFHETEWASLAILHGYSPFPCCLWQPWGVPWSQMGNLAALASGALRSTPRGTGALCVQGTGKLRLSRLCCNCASPRPCGRDNAETVLSCFIRRDNQLDWQCSHTSRRISASRP